MSNERPTFANERSRKAIEARPVPRGIRKPRVAPPLLAIPLSQLECVHLVPDVGDHDAILVSYDPLPEWAAVNVGVGWVGGGLAGGQRKVGSYHAPKRNPSPASNTAGQEATGWRGVIPGGECGVGVWYDWSPPGSRRRTTATRVEGVKRRG
jgi:hypothetical protein